MALTITQSTIHPKDVWGALPIAVVTATPAASDYVTGGYSLPPGTGIPLGTPIFGVFTLGDTGGTTGVLLKWNTSTSLLQVFVTGSAAGANFAEASAGSNFSGFTFTLLIVGINP